ncbi:MAG: hypothetical protein GXY47_15215 [Acidobacteria bacterium]|nr:hypothetical protein [Acidobacteriota bacterium]
MKRKESYPGGRGERADAFRRQAERKPGGVVKELFLFLLHSKKWWLTPIIIVLLALTLIAFLGGTGAAPFIYTLF